jgi:hypothetical protein
MSKKQRQTDSTTKPSVSTDRLIVRGIRRKEPDWDTYVTILLAHALEKVGAGVNDLDEGDDD